eukprot:scaffold3504_cov240-Pinguiococcus_pyrenoidosus.AAC.63
MCKYSTAPAAFTCATLGIEHELPGPHGHARRLYLVKSQPSAVRKGTSAIPEEADPVAVVAHDVWKLVSLHAASTVVRESPRIRSWASAIHLKCRRFPCETCRCLTKPLWIPLR